MIFVSSGAAAASAAGLSREFGGRSGRRSTGFLDVRRDDSSARTAPLHLLEAHAHLGGHLARERRGFPPSAFACRGHRDHVLREIAPRSLLLDRFVILAGRVLDRVLLVRYPTLRRFVFLLFLLAFAEDFREHAADRNHVAFFRGLLAERSVRLGFEIEIHFVRLDLRDRLPLLHAIARLFVPLDDLSLGHRVAHLRHDYFGHGDSLSSRKQR